MIAPVAMFVYNRVDNTQQTLEHLLANTMAQETDLYIFSDGWKVGPDGLPDAKSQKAVLAVRDYLHRVKAWAERKSVLRSMTIVERPTNFYLERNITEGIAQIFEKYDRVIVLEDDICISPYFLQYMNVAFKMYKDVKSVMHVSGFTNLDLLAADGNADTQPFYFTPHMSGWGWGTWRDRWQEHFRHYDTEEEALAGMTEADKNAMQYGGVFPCLKSLKKRPIPWDICWEIAIYKAGGLCLTPARTLVRNIGLKNGTHFQAYDFIQRYEYDRVPSEQPVTLSLVSDPKKDDRIERLFAEAITDWGIRYTPFGKVLRWGFKQAQKLLPSSLFKIQCS